jgi:DNA gyrase subunit A
MSVNFSDNEQIRELIPVPIEDEMKRSYLDYAMSVIVSRALPDVRDGLKPVHRRILYAMYESGCDFNKPFRKSARIVGEVMGKYHPHGDAAIYDALVRMAQDFSLRLPLIDGQGNFGSMDGDAAAAMRYTESRLAKVAHSLLNDIDKETVGFHPNYDGSEQEPDLLPAQFPNLLVNGAGGIAVGMATNIPPHNLGEVIDACCAYIDNPEITIDEMMEIVPGPDFPTGAMILGKGGIRSAMRTGRGSIIMRGKTNIEDINNRTAIIITEVPYMVNKAKMIERIAELVREKRIEGISDLRDESDKSGVRVVVEIKRDAIADVVLNQLYSYTPLQTSFGVNMLALHDGMPQVMNFLDVIRHFVNFREIVVTNRTIFLLKKSRERAHLLIGLSVAVSNIDEVIALIRASKDANEAKEALMSKPWHANSDIVALIDLISDRGNKVENGQFYFTEAQAKAILEMRLQRLTGLEYHKITNELSELATEIRHYLEILASRPLLMNIIKNELLAIKTEFATPRLTQISESEFEQDIEDLIQKEDMVVVVTMGGYIKRVPLSTYRAQKRGGKGRSAMTIKEDDITTDVFVANTHTPILFFSTTGKVYKLKVYKLPLGTPQSKGRALVNIFPLTEGETINNVLALPEDKEALDSMNIMFATQKGNVRRNDLSDFHHVMSNGKIAIRLDEDDKLVGVVACAPTDHILLSSYQGKCLRFPVEAVRVFKSRTSDGVIGMRLAEGDKVISMSVLHGAEAPTEERDSYLRIPLEKRQNIAKLEDEGEANNLLIGEEVALPVSQIYSMAKAEEFILTITENGYGKRSSAYEYRITNRGGSGIVSIVTSERNGQVVSSLPVSDTDQIMLMTNKGTVIRCPVKDIRIIGRNTQGVMLFRVAEGEVVTSVARIADAGREDDEEAEDINSDSEQIESTEE